ncbi:hypothetical protein [Oceanobacillus oncorhynchi]|uniref:hypothetical protein n=1 Tax=Oceanobacillus oncorhynchi TaxID=545501 RepID=UPI0034D7AC2E
MTKVPLDKCEWCNGSGVDSDGISVGNPYPCTDCEGTGFKYGEEAMREELRLANEEGDRLERKGLI